METTPVPTSLVAAPALLEALPDVVVVVDRNGCIVYANPALRSLLGHDPADLRGRPLTVLVPERRREAYAAGFPRLLAADSEGLLGGSTHLPVLRADGSEIAVELTLSRVADAGTTVPGGAVIGVLRDISTTVRLQRQLEVGRYLNAILRVTSTLTTAHDADDAFEQ